MTQPNKKLTLEEIRAMSDNNLNIALATYDGWHSIDTDKLTGLKGPKEVRIPIPKYTDNYDALYDLKDAKVVGGEHLDDWELEINRKSVSWLWHMPARQYAEHLLHFIIEHSSE